MMEKKFFKGNHSNKVADNRFVVPYNPYLLLKFNSYINVEVCSTVQCIKYLFKYCYKGHDFAFIEMSNIDLFVFIIILLMQENYMKNAIH